MKLSSPVHVLKSQAKSLKRAQAISMTEALDLIAKREGFQSWSLLQSKVKEILPSRYGDIIGYLNPGDLALIGGRPGVGKTSFSIGLFAQAIRHAQGKHFFFTLDLVRGDVERRIGAFDKTIDLERFCVDYSDAINAQYITEKTAGHISPGSLIVIDYLQMLDQKRVNPPLQDQVEKLKAYAQDTGCVILFISQVDRAVESRGQKRPTAEDIRLPNPLDLIMFNKILLLYREQDRSKEVEVSFFRPKAISFKVGWNADTEIPIFFDL